MKYAGKIFIRRWVFLFVSSASEWIPLGETACFSIHSAPQFCSFLFFFSFLFLLLMLFYMVACVRLLLKAEYIIRLRNFISPAQIEFYRSMQQRVDNRKMCFSWNSLSRFFFINNFYWYLCFVWRIKRKKKKRSKTFSSTGKWDKMYTHLSGETRVEKYLYERNCVYCVYCWALLWIKPYAQGTFIHTYKCYVVYIITFFFLLRFTSFFLYVCVFVYMGMEWVMMGECRHG